ncbi:hypothetical protein QBC46DRAFT_322591 [Diplogelasinospora grovesii]|uniref:TauD/TfdA-like domain-containing protein n=1 Tax=Diplogelasinospora grovesii TaxID=303347 RepID=A0AAN6N0B8_9PEZI|nr:hypothetical protein QBC46DRAFT_322591 [Diplogelasinospora grovesii]
MANRHGDIDMKGLESHAMAWVPQDFANASTPPYIVQLGEEDVVEVEEALDSFKDLGLDGDAVSRDKFPLPKLQERLREACLNVHHGQGFAIVRGLDPDTYSVEDNLSLYLGIASYIGDKRGMQDKKGNMITHVTDSKNWSAPHQVRHGIHTNSGLAWHNDMGVDILALHVRANAEIGGQTYVAPAWTICKELSKSHPDVLETLMQPRWPIQISGSPPRHILAPLLQVYEGKIMISLDPGRLGLHPATARLNGNSAVIPDLTDAQRGALDTVAELATNYRLCLDTQPGDMVFINNWALLHARDPYVDPADGARPRRHLVRLWLRNSELGWDIPPTDMRAPWEAAFGTGKDTEKEGKGGGWYRGAKVDKKYPVVPALEYKVPRYTAGSAAFMIEDNDDVNAQA